MRGSSVNQSDAADLSGFSEEEWRWDGMEWEAPPREMQFYSLADTF